MDATRWAGIMPTAGSAGTWARRALVNALAVATLLSGPLAAPTPAGAADEAGPGRPAGVAAPAPDASGAAAPVLPSDTGPAPLDVPRAAREPPPDNGSAPPDGPPAARQPLADSGPAPPAEPPSAQEPPSGSAPGPSGGPRVLQVPAPPDGAGTPAPGAGYAWPLLPVPAIAARFRAPAHPFGPGHRGVDLVGTAGQPVLAARSGTVVFAGPIGSRSVVSVDHDDGLRTTYEPLRPVVRPGAVVRAGDVLGLLEPGHPGCAAAPCLHWGVRRGPREYLDPLVLLRPPEVRLLPVPDPWPDGIVTARGPPAARGRALNPRRAPPACRAAARRAWCAAGTPATR